jgi:hypothetical protein
MRTKITIFAIGLLLAIGFSGLASPGYAQTLQRPVNAPPTTTISLAELAAQVNPGRAGAAGRTYTNADLTMRPAPVAPVMPPFPEIAAPTGILEHPGVPPIEREPAPGIQQYGGIPLWDDGFGVVDDFSSRSGFRGRRQVFQQANSVQFGIDGRFSKPSTPSSILLGPPTIRGSHSGRRAGSFRSGSGRGGSHGGGRGGRGR